MDEKQRIRATHWTEIKSGAKALLPLLLGVVPFGLASGVAVSQTGITPGDGIVMSVLVFSGAALLVALQLINSGAPVLISLISSLIVNLRFMIYSASLAPYFRKLPFRWKVLLSYLLSDQAYAVSILRFNNENQSSTRHLFFLGAAVTMWIAWQVSVGLGIVLGLKLAANLSLEFTIPLTFLALVVPAIKDRSTAMAALSAGVSVILLNNLPYKLGQIVAALIGILVGVLVERSSVWKKSGSS
jgi:4-azaleucine resistance transporter AzlC